MKSYLTEFVDYSKCERKVLLSSLAILFIMAMNFNKEALPAIVTIPIMMIATLIGLINYAALVYWIVYFWSQYTIGDKLLKISKAVLLMILLLMALSFTYVYIDFYF